MGDLHAKFERIKAKLSAEGLFDPAKRLALVSTPRRIAVVTSLAAAALRDVLTTMRRRAPHVEVYVYPTAVQGTEAADQLCIALGQAIAHNNAEAVLLVRGGGSLEDLWSFNDERLARLIHASPIPVISGVGHETDFTIADFVADLRAPTPTAAAELSCQSWQQSNADLLGVLRNLQQVQARIIDKASMRLDHAAERLVSPQQRLAHKRQQHQAVLQRLARALSVTGQRQQLHHVCHRLQRSLPQTQPAQQALHALQGGLLQSMQQQLKHQQQRLALAQQTLQALNPNAVLERGYAIVRNQKGTIIKNSLDTQINESLQVQLAHGHLHVKLKQKHDLL